MNHEKPQIKSEPTSEDHEFDNKEAVREFWKKAKEGEGGKKFFVDQPNPKYNGPKVDMKKAALRNLEEWGAKLPEGTRPAEAEKNTAIYREVRPLKTPPDDVEKKWEVAYTVAEPGMRHIIVPSLKIRNSSRRSFLSAAHS